MLLKLVLKKSFSLLIIFFTLYFAPNLHSQEQEENAQPFDFSDGNFILLPILETVFSGNINWRPDSPYFIPPDAFSVVNTNRPPQLIELSNDTYTFTVKRDAQNRLLEFPVFYSDGYAIVTAEYSATGAIQKMNFTKIIFSDENESAQEESAQNETSQSAETSQSDENNNEEPLEIQFEINLPQDFLPYSDFSPGGSFPAIEVNTGDSVFYVYIFESPRFLTETWYNQDGEMLFFSRASIITENGNWKISSLQVHGHFGILYTDYFFDSYGNITEIRNSGTVAEAVDEEIFSALYQSNRPVYHQFGGYQFSFQWDTRGLLPLSRMSFIDAHNTASSAEIEWRFEYKLDDFGNWTNRVEMPHLMQFNLLTPHPALSGGEWNRSIEYQENGE